MTNPMIPAEAVEAAGIPYEATAAASEALEDDAYALIGWEGVTRILEAAAPHMLAEVTALVAALTDPDDCWFDHHGGCQAHGYLDLKIGEMCPQLEAKVWAHNHRTPDAS